MTRRYRHTHDGGRRGRGGSGSAAGGGPCCAGAMAAVLQQLLERAELAKLPRAVQGKLERFLGDQQGEIDGLRARHERFKVDSGECGRRARGAAAVPGLRGGSAGTARNAVLFSRGSRSVPWGL